MERKRQMTGGWRSCYSITQRTFLTLPIFSVNVCEGAADRRREKLVSLCVTLGRHVNMIFHYLWSSFSSSHTHIHTHTHTQNTNLSSLLLSETKLSHSDKVTIGGTPSMATMEVSSSPVQYMPLLCIIHGQLYDIKALLLLIAFAEKSWVICRGDTRETLRHTTSIMSH